MENNFLFSLVDSPEFWFSPDINTAGPWLGGHQIHNSPSPADGWQWVTGETWEYECWGSGEPNDIGDHIENNEENYVCFWAWGENTRNRIWNDAAGTAPPGYIIESPSRPLPNLILNPSFEDPGDLSTITIPDTTPTEAPTADNPIYTLPDASTAIAHWEVEIDPTLVNPVEPDATIDWTHSENYAASHGERSVDLNGTPGPGGIKQTFSTTAGAEYELWFDLAGNPRGNATDPDTGESILEQWGLTEDKIKTLRVELESDGVVFDSREFDFDVTGHTPEDVGWITEGWTFEAIGEETTLRFKSLAWSVDGSTGDAGIDAMDFGPTIDHIRVYQTSIPGDLDGDGFVGSADLDIVREHWNETVTPGDLSMGDADGDGFVGSGDLDTVRANWGDSLFAAAVPEPGVGVLVVLGMAVVMWRKWGL